MDPQIRRHKAAPGRCRRGSRRFGRACRRVSQAPLTAGISRTNQVLFSTELVAFFGAVEWHDSILTPMRPIEFVL